MKPCTYRRFGVEQSFGERVCTKFVQLVVIVALVLGFFVSGTRSAHAGEFVAAKEEAFIGVMPMHNVVACDTKEQAVVQAHEFTAAINEQRDVKPMEGCGTMFGKIPAFVVIIGTLITGEVELTMVRYETTSRYGNQYGWLSNVRQISSI